MKIGHIEFPIKEVEIISNNDMKVIDFLLDLKMEGLNQILKDIEEKDVSFTTACLYSFEHKIAVLVVYKPIKSLGEFDGKYLVFVAPSYQVMKSYLHGYYYKAKTEEKRNAFGRLIGDIGTHESAIATKDTSKYEQMGLNFFKRIG